MSTRKERLVELVWAREHIRKDDLEREVALNLTRWPDYSFMSPFAATLEFVAAYQRQYRAAYRIYVDAMTADSIIGINLRRFNEDSAVHRRVWRARARADEVGMRYDTYVKASIDFAMLRSVKTNGAGITSNRFFPAPGQLHHPGAGEKAWAVWRTNVHNEELMAGVGDHPDHPAFYADHYEGLPAQVRFRELMLAAAQQSGPGLSGWMQRLVYDYRQVPAEEFERRFSPAVVEVQRSMLRVPAQPRPKPEILPEGLWQSCFGAGAQVQLACGQCPQTEQCSRMLKVVDQIVLKRTGSTEPVEDAVRHGNRVRQQRYRDRRKSGQPGSKPLPVGHYQKTKLEFLARRATLGTPEVKSKATET